MTAAVDRDTGLPEPPPRDIYALLGITPEALPELARQLHRERVERLRERTEQQDDEALREVEALNDALALVLEPRRRAEYNRTYHLVRERDEAEEGRRRIARARRTHIGAGVSLFVAAMAIALLTWALWSGMVAVIVIGVGVIAASLVTAWPSRAIDDPFAILGLSRDASRHHIDIAYELLAQEQLQRLQHGLHDEDRAGTFGRLRGDRALVRRLEVLDSARLRAKQVLVERYVESSLPPPGPLVRVRRAIATFPEQAAYVIGDALVEGAGRLGRRLRRPEPGEDANEGANEGAA